MRSLRFDIATVLRVERAIVGVLAARRIGVPAGTQVTFERHRCGYAARVVWSMDGVLVANCVDIGPGHIEVMPPVGLEAG
jgi:hypothetical protein